MLNNRTLNDKNLVDKGAICGAAKDRAASLYRECSLVYLSSQQVNTYKAIHHLNSTGRPTYAKKLTAVNKDTY